MSRLSCVYLTISTINTAGLSLGVVNRAVMSALVSLVSDAAEDLKQCVLALIAELPDVWVILQCLLSF